MYFCDKLGTLFVQYCTYYYLHCLYNTVLLSTLYNSMYVLWMSKLADMALRTIIHN